MILTLATVSMLLLTNGVGLLVSLYFDKHGLPPGWNNQASPRKPGSLRPRLPLIALNLGIMIVGTALTLPFISGGFSLALPTPLQVLAHLGLLFVADDLWFYGLHRLLHQHKGLYKRIHKLHHKAFAPVPIEYIYVHPLEWMSGAMGPILLMALIALVQGQMNAWTFLMWSTLRTLHELDIHSGIRSVLSRALPIVAPMEHHDLHHAKPNLGNYASTFLIWDRLLGTEVDRARIKGG